MAAWWGLTLLFASQVELCIPDCSGSSPRSRTEGSTVLGAVGGPRSEEREYSCSPGVVPFPPGSCFSSCRGACPLCLASNLPRPGFSSASPCLFPSFPRPAPAGAPGKCLKPVPVAPCCCASPSSDTDPHLPLLPSLRDPPSPARTAAEAPPRRPGPALARGAPGGSLRGQSVAAGATGIEGWNGNGINPGLCHSAVIGCERRG